MAESIKVFENSLRDYLINIQQDSYNGAGKIEYRYNNLKVYMEPKKNKTPHFCVSLGISEASYMIAPVQKMTGSLGGNDEKYVIMWASRPNINGELKKHWAYLIKASTIDVDDNNIANEKIIVNKVSKKTKEVLEEESASFASEIITGGGVDNKTSETKSNFNVKRRQNNN